MLKILIGRRIPKCYNKSLIDQHGNLLHIQENVWKKIIELWRFFKKVNYDKKSMLTITIQKYKEYDNLQYRLEWLVINISSPIKDYEKIYEEKIKKVYTGLENFKLFNDKCIVEIPDLNKAPNSRYVTKEEYESLLRHYPLIEDKEIRAKMFMLGILHFIKNDDIDEKDPYIKLNI